MRTPLFRPILSHKMRVLLGISLSILVHIFLLVATRWIPPTPPRSALVEVVLIDDSSQNKTEKSFVVDSKIPQKMLRAESNDPAQYLSEQTQRVENEMRAAVTGATKNRSNAQATPNAAASPQSPKSSNRASSSATKSGESPIIVPEYRKEARRPNSPPDREMTSATKTSRLYPELEQGVSTVGEVLPMDLEIGSFTALNTDRHLYYTFFARINEMIRFRWESAVRSTIDGTPPDRYKYNPLGVWTTHVEVVLNQDGVVKDVVLMKPSGFRGFDQAAQYSFWDSRAFFNPPREMVDKESGEIRLKYSFQVNYRPKIHVKVSQ